MRLVAVKMHIRSNLPKCSSFLFFFFSFPLVLLGLNQNFGLDLKSSDTHSRSDLESNFQQCFGCVSRLRNLDILWDNLQMVHFYVTGIQIIL